jgi:hypothetical protein
MSSRNGPSRKSEGWRARSSSFSLLLVVACLCCASLRATDKPLRELQEHFDKEEHSGRKIKELQKLGPAQFAAATDSGNSGNYVEVGLIFEKYRDNVRAAFELLKKQVPDVDHHPGDYRQLELGLRQGIREVEDTLLTVPEPVKPPLQLVRKDLLDMDDALINLLFPRHTPEPVKVAPPPEAKP